MLLSSINQMIRIMVYTTIVNQRHPNKNLGYLNVINKLTKFLETKSVANKIYTTQVANLGHAGLDPTSGTIKLATNYGIPPSILQRNLIKHRFHLCKVHFVQELKSLYLTRFSFLFRQRQQSCRYWSNSIPRIMREHTQYPEKMNLRTGILGNYIIDPLFL